MQPEHERERQLEPLPLPIGSTGTAARSTTPTCPAWTASSMRAFWYSSRSWSDTLRMPSTCCASRTSSAPCAGSAFISATLRARRSSSAAMRALRLAGLAAHNVHELAP